MNNNKLYRVLFTNGVSVCSVHESLFHAEKFMDNLCSIYSYSLVSIKEHKLRPSITGTLQC